MRFAYLTLVFFFHSFELQLVGRLCPQVSVIWNELGTAEVLQFRCYAVDVVGREVMGYVCSHTQRLAEL
jgi:hypothetical protein